MEVNASIPYIKVDISDYEAKEIAVSVISKKFGICKSNYIDHDGCLCDESEISAGTHSSFESTKIRIATPLDLAVIEVLKSL